MPPAEISTSLQRTYRYLRIGIAGTVVVIFVSVGLAAASVGWLTSVSDYFYSPARDALGAGNGGQRPSWPGACSRGRSVPVGAMLE